MIDRLKQCLGELGVEYSGHLTQLRPLYRLVADLVPDRKQIMLRKVAVRRSERRLKIAMKHEETLRQAIERVLCDGLSARERVAVLENALKSVGYEDEWS